MVCFWLLDFYWIFHYCPGGSEDLVFSMNGSGECRICVCGAVDIFIVIEVVQNYPCFNIV